MKRVFRLYFFNPVVLVGVIVLVLSMIFFVASLMIENRQRFSTVSRASSTPMQIVPPVMYTDLSQIEFVPRRINEHFFSANLLSEYRALYPELKTDPLQKLIVEHALSWAALRDIYKVNNLTISDLADFAEVEGAQIERELPLLLADYQARTMRLDGFYLKVRFRGIYKDTLEKLNKQPKELQELAMTKIQEYIDEARKLKEPATILDSFNSDKTIVQMNNGEQSVEFSEYSLDPPLFDDPAFYETIEHSPLKAFSPVSILKTRNPMSPDFEEYAYVTYFITSREGNYLPIAQITSEYLKVAVIR